MERKFKTTAKCAGCVKAIGEKLSKELAADQWSIDLTSPDRMLTVAADTPSDARIEELVAEYEVEKIVLGLPKHMNNDIGDRAEKSMAFGEMLKRRTGLEVVMWDERLTTVEAERTLIENKVRREDRKKYIDKIAAVFILQGYLDSLAHTPLD